MRIAVLLIGTSIAGGVGCLPRSLVLDDADGAPAVEAGTSSTTGSATGGGITGTNGRTGSEGGTTGIRDGSSSYGDDGGGNATVSDGGNGTVITGTSATGAAAGTTGTSVGMTGGSGGATAANSATTGMRGTTGASTGTGATTGTTGTRGTTSTTGTTGTVGGTTGTTGSTGGASDGGAMGCAVQIAAGDKHVCAVKEDGSLWCWGNNSRHQLGINATGTSPPTQVMESGVAEVTAAYEHTCARKTDGTVWCWGTSGDGQIGNGSLMPANGPVQVLTNAIEIVAGQLHTCARTTEGELYCWGQNQYGQIGDGMVDGTTCAELCQPSPVLLTTFGMTVVDVSTTDESTCAVNNFAAIFCWGSNTVSQLGRPMSSGAGTMTCSGGGQCDPVPRSVGLTGIAKLGRGPSALHMCAIETDGILYCWGDNYYVEVGNPDPMSTPAQVQPSPLEVDLGGSVAGVAMGQRHTCAYRTDGALFCWGDNTSGQMGDGTTTSKIGPVEVKALGHAVAEVALGRDFTCARKTDGTVYCWGTSNSGQTGTGTGTGLDCTPSGATMCEPNPVQVPLPCP
jgi:hypothetical protein